MSPKFEKLLADLRSGDTVRTLNATIELNSELSMAQDNLTAHMRVEDFIGPLVDCLHNDEMPDILVYANMCILNLLDLNPTFCVQLVQHGAVDVLALKIQSIDFIDVAENALKVRTPHSLIIPT